MERAKGDYLKALRQEWAKLRVVGEVEFSLGDKYVMPQVSPSSPGNSLEGRPDVPQTDSRLAQAGLRRESDSPSKKQSADKDPDTPIPLSRMFAQATHLAMLGEPGAGKSTALRFVGLCLATEGWAEQRLGIDKAYVPILLDLKEFAEDKNIALMIEAALAGSVNKYLRDPDEASIQSLVEKWLAKGKVFALLDGLDEVPDRLRSRIRDEVRHFAASEKGRKNRVLLAARLAGFSALGEPFREFLLRPFDGSPEISAYVENWLAALCPSWTSSRVSQAAGQLVSEMTAQPALRRILDNPLILRLSAEVYAQNGTVARNRAELYKRYLAVAWENALGRGVEETRRDLTFQELEDLAWRLQTQEKPDGVANLDLLRVKLGLVAKVGDGVIFSHQTFQEYLAACKLKKAYEADRKRAWGFLRARLHVPRWREPILLLGEMLDDETSQALVSQVIRADSPYEKELARDFVLACELIEAGASVDERSIAALLTRAKKVLSWWPSLVFKILRPFINEFHPSWEKFSKPRFIFPFESLGALGTPAIPFLVHALRSQNDETREAMAQALGKMQPAEVLPTLLELLKDEELEIRSAAALAIGDLRSADAVPHLIASAKDVSEEVRGAVATALGRIRSAESVPHLLKALKGETSNVRYRIKDALSGFRPDDVLSQLVIAMDDEDEQVRDDIVTVLRQINSPKVVPILLTALRDTSTKVRSSAEYALRQIVGTEAIPHLGAALKSENSYVRDVAAETLGKIGSAEATRPLMEALQDSNSQVLDSVISALGRIGSPEATQPLIELWEIGHHRPLVLLALGDIGSKEAGEYLLRRLKDKDSELNLAAAYSLRKTHPSLVLPRLLAVMKDNNVDDDIRSAMADALAEMPNAEGLEDLVKCLDDKDWRVPMYAAHVLGEYKNVETMPHLFKLARYHDRDVQQAAYGALNKFRSTEAVPYFISGLNNDQVRLVSLRSLGEIGAVEGIPHISQLLNDNGFWQLEAAKALAKILTFEKIPNTAKLKTGRVDLLSNVIRVLRRNRTDSYDTELLSLWKQAAVRLTELKLASGEYPDDPFEAAPEVMSKRVLRKAGLALLSVLVLGIVALVGVLAGAAGDILKDRWKQGLVAWSGAHPIWALVVIVVVLAGVAGLLAVLVEPIKKRWKSPVMKDAD